MVVALFSVFIFSIFLLSLCTLPKDKDKRVKSREKLTKQPKKQTSKPPTPVTTPTATPRKTKTPDDSGKKQKKRRSREKSRESKEKVESKEKLQKKSKELPEDKTIYTFGPLPTSEKEEQVTDIPSTQEDNPLAKKEVQERLIKTWRQPVIITGNTRSSADVSRRLSPTQADSMMKGAERRPSLERFKIEAISPVLSDKNHSSNSKKSDRSARSVERRQSKERFSSEEDYLAMTMRKAEPKNGNEVSMRTKDTDPVAKSTYL